MARDLKKKRAHDLARKLKRAKMIQEIKLIRGCADCGYNQHGEALEFDHLSDKKHNVSAIRGNKWEDILLEIAKCDVVCANCHRVRTVRRRALTGKSPLPTELSVN